MRASFGPLRLPFFLDNMPLAEGSVSRRFAPIRRPGGLRYSAQNARAGGPRH